MTYRGIIVLIVWIFYIPAFSSGYIQTDKRNSEKENQKIEDYSLFDIKFIITNSLFNKSMEMIICNFNNRIKYRIFYKYLITILINNAFV